MFKLSSDFVLQENKYTKIDFQFKVFHLFRCESTTYLVTTCDY